MGWRWQPVLFMSVLACGTGGVADGGAATGLSTAGPTSDATSSTSSEPGSTGDQATASTSGSGTTGSTGGGTAGASSGGVPPECALGNEASGSFALYENGAPTDFEGSNGDDCVVESVTTVGSTTTMAVGQCPYVPDMVLEFTDLGHGGFQMGDEIELLFGRDVDGGAVNLWMRLRDADNNLRFAWIDGPGQTPWIGNEPIIGYQPFDVEVFQTTCKSDHEECYDIKLYDVVEVRNDDAGIAELLMPGEVGMLGDFTVEVMEAHRMDCGDGPEPRLRMAMYRDGGP